MKKNWNTNYKKTRNYFINRLGFKNRAIERMFTIYCCQHKIYLHEDAANEIQKNWDAFMKWWGTVKHLFKDSYFKRKQESYNDYNDVQEALQYSNGSTEDF